MARRKEFPQISATSVENLWKLVTERNLPLLEGRVDELARIFQAYLDERSGKMLEAFKQLETALLLPPYAYDLLRRIPNEKVSIMEDGVRDMTVIPELPHAKNEADDMQHLTALRCRVHEAIAMMKSKENRTHAQRHLCERLYQAFGVKKYPFRNENAAPQTGIETLLRLGLEMVPTRYRFQLSYARRQGWLGEAYGNVREKKIQGSIMAIGKLNDAITDDTPTTLKDAIKAEVNELDADIKKHLVKRKARPQGRPKKTPKS